VKLRKSVRKTSGEEVTDLRAAVRERLKKARRDLRNFKNRADYDDPSDVRILYIHQGRVMALNDLLYDLNVTLEGK